MDTWERTIRDLFGASDGKRSPVELLDAVASTWEGFSVFDRARIAESLKTNPPLHAAQVAEAQRVQVQAAGIAAESAQQASVLRLDETRRFRELQRENPFAAAELAARAGNPLHLFDPDDGGNNNAA